MQFIRQRAIKYGLDPNAVLAIGSVEGYSALHGGTSIGDNGTSFGPFQLHEGGALPKGKDSNWAHSAAGIDYALRRMSAVARGLQGQAAVQAISSRFERPADVSGEVSKAMQFYGGGSSKPLDAAWGPHSGSGGTVGGKAGQGQSGLPPASMQAFKSMAAAVMLQQSAATAAGGQPDSSGLLALAAARKQFDAANGAFGAQPTTAPLQASGFKGLALPIEGNIGSENPHFLSALTHAAKARGAVRIVATSGERSAKHNASIGGASHSNHLPGSDGFGHAMDGYAVLPNGTRVPLGQFLLPNAGKFGLRSGATFNWGGKPDVVHVDDGYNQQA